MGRRSPVVPQHAATAAAFGRFRRAVADEDHAGMLREALRLACRSGMQETQVAPDAPIPQRV